MESSSGPGFPARPHAAAHPHPGLDAIDSWVLETDRLAPQIAASALAWSLVHLASRVIDDKNAEIAGLRTMLDETQGRTVLSCMARDVATLIGQAGDTPDGTILRTTDTGAELVKTAGSWLPR